MALRFRYISVLAVLSFLAVALLPFLSGCGREPGKLVLVDVAFPDSVDVTQTRQIDFVLRIRNDGGKPCTVQNIYTPDFWKTDRPGLTGNTNVVFDKEVLPGQEETFRVPAYIWDADILQDHMKRFAITANILYNEDCPQAFLTKEGLIWLYK